MVTIAQRWRLDIIMTIGLICCMSYSLIGKALHEWIGTAVLALFVLHLARNRRWFTSLRRGRWNGARVLGSVLCGLVCFVTLGLIVSSLMLSEYVFAFLPLGLPEGVGQTPHQVCAYWGFFFIALHLGQHGRSAQTMLAQRFHLPARFWRAFLALICVGGAAAFFWQNLPAHLTLSAGEFAPACGLGTYLAAYFAIFILAAVLGYGLKRLLDRERSRS